MSLSRPSHGWTRGVIAVAAGLALGGCGAAVSTLPPAPSGANDFVPLARLARYPEVYIAAHVTTIGTLHRLAGEDYELDVSGVRTQISVYPARLAKPLVGRRVRASGTFAVTFQTGYELHLTAIAPTGG